MINRFLASAPSASVLATNSQARKSPSGDSFVLLLDAMAAPPIQDQPREQQNPLQERDSGFQLITNIIAGEKQPQLEELGTEYLFLAEAKKPAIIDPGNGYLLMTEAKLPEIEIPAIESLLLAEPKPPQIEVPGTEYFFMADEKLPNPNTENDFDASLLNVTDLVSVPVADETASVSMDFVSQDPIPANSDFLQLVASRRDQAPSDDSSSSFALVDTIRAQDFAGMEAVNFVATAAQAAPEMRVQSRSSSEAGVVELVSEPWRLQANAGMSYRSTLHKFHDVSNATLQTEENTNAKPSNSNARMVSIAGLNVSSGFYDTGAAQVNMPYKFMNVVSELVDIFEMARTERSNARASMVVWPHRALHWLADGEATTAWVRDYQLDSNEIKSLIDGLRCVAEQQGFTLRRIMLNGHEAWRAPSTF